MTEEEAIRELKIQFVGEYDRQREAKDMAIKSLEQQKTGCWIDIDEESHTAICSCCNRNNLFYGDYCKWCGAKMERRNE